MQPTEHPLSLRQALILNFIKEATDRWGYPPSLREIGTAAGLRSTASVAYQIKKLEGRGLIRRESNRPRTYQIVTKSELPTAVSSAAHRALRGGLSPDNSTNESGMVFVLVEISPEVGNAVLDGALLTVGRNVDRSCQPDPASIVGRVVAITDSFVAEPSFCPPGRTPARFDDVPEELNATPCV